MVLNCENCTELADLPFRVAHRTDVFTVSSACEMNQRVQQPNLCVHSAYVVYVSLVQTGSLKQLWLTRYSLYQFFSQIKESITEKMDTNHFKNWLKCLLICISKIFKPLEFRFVHWQQYCPSQYLSLQVINTFRYHLCLKIFCQFST